MEAARPRPNFLRGFLQKFPKWPPIRPINRAQRIEIYTHLTRGGDLLLAGYGNPAFSFDPRSYPEKVWYIDPSIRSFFDDVEAFESK